jgi:hypothetical protein
MSNYFDKKTGLKIQTITYVKTPQGEVAVPIQFQDYKDVNGVKLPQTLIQSMGPMKLKFENSSAEANVALDDSLFKVQ